MPEMQGMVLRGFKPHEFEAYLQNEVASKMEWAPVGVTLHNTGKMVWPGIVNGKQITPQQRLKNMSVDWVSRKFFGGPHLVIAPDGMIWCAWPCWKRGTHSPSFNRTHFGVELVGDFRTQELGWAQRNAGEIAVTALLKLLKRQPSAETFTFHSDDAKTSHRECPGKNVGSKASWLLKLKERYNRK